MEMRCRSGYTGFSGNMIRSFPVVLAAVGPGGFLVRMALENEGVNCRERVQLALWRSILAWAVGDAGASHHAPAVGGCAGARYPRECSNGIRCGPVGPEVRSHAARPV